MVKICETKFSDIYVTPEKEVFIPDPYTEDSLMFFEPEDFDAFFALLEKGWDGKNSSYSIIYEKSIYRVERTEAIYGIQYCARKMPEKTPFFASLGFKPELVRHLLSLSSASGLILCSGPTGSGKTTTVSSLLKEYLDEEGGFAYTIEDPTEMPLDGVYKARNGGIGLCKQTQPPHGDWGEGLKSALRTKPRFILVGEIRTPETASEVLRAATSGHLVLSTIHGNNVSDAISSVIKYASATSMSEELAFDLFSRGMLGVLHQHLYGVGIKIPIITHLFANPDTTRGDQVRGIIKSGKLNLATAIETQMTRLSRGMNIFPELG
ncbi:MAG: GspE family protein [Lactobacillaceae bacterium]|jgi:twitching motility protein PilT|nr:GspE family protein [Lactobacillaceae bacterium]